MFFYDVFLNDIKVADNILETAYYFEGLTENLSYQGKITASDPEENTTTVDFSFKTNKNNAPSNFQISIDSSNPIVPRISWTASEDPDEDIVVYTIYLENELIASELTTLSYFLPELFGLQTYTGYIEAIDVHGKKTTATYSITTEMKILDDDVILENQYQVTAFGEKGYNKINGYFYIGSPQNNLTDINDLSSLITIRDIAGNLTIKKTVCTNLEGLNNVTLSYVYSDLTINNNDRLVSLDALNKITSLNRLSIHNNKALLHLDGFISIYNIRNDIRVISNYSLIAITGLENLNYVGDMLEISGNNSLTTLEGLENISALENLTIYNNDNLYNLKGLDNLKKCNHTFLLTSNKSLNNLHNLKSLTSIGGITIRNNASLINLTGLETLTSINYGITIATNKSLTTLKGIEKRSIL